MRDDFEATLPVAEIFERLEVPYYIGGSVASSMHGVGRSTMDVDIVARAELRHVKPIVRALESDFYIDETMFRDAIQQRSSFNLIHFHTQHKVDIFIDRNRPFDRTVWSRIVQAVPFEGSMREFPIASADNILLSKLE